MSDPHSAATLHPSIPQAVEKIALQVLDRAHERKLSLTAAESCTGGLLAALLTDVRGRGHVFERGFVTYSEDAKCDLLGVARDQVERCGAVSRPVALAMARGALANSKADIAVSITGFAGPGGEGDEEGLVHFACVRRGGAAAHRACHFGAIGRAGVRIAALDVALAMVNEALER
jgi:nicotinamide-nucleotide amidase